MLFFSEKKSRVGGQERLVVGWTTEIDYIKLESWSKTLGSLVTLSRRKGDIWKKRGRDIAYVEPVLKPRLEQELHCGEVNEQYFELLMIIGRENRIKERSKLTKEQELYFKTQKTKTLSYMIRYRFWVDEPENLSIGTANGLFRKIDLGRRTDLNFSSDDTGEEKYSSNEYARRHMARSDPEKISRIDSLHEIASQLDSELELRSQNGTLQQLADRLYTEDPKSIMRVLLAAQMTGQTVKIPTDWYLERGLPVPEGSI